MPKTQHRRRLRERHEQEQGWLCFYCQQPMVRKESVFDRRPNVSTLEHIRPVADGGGNTYENTCAACYACNELKGGIKLTVADKEVVRAAFSRGL